MLKIYQNLEQNMPERMPLSYESGKEIFFELALKDIDGFKAVKEKLKSDTKIMQEFKIATKEDYEARLHGNLQKTTELEFVKNIIKPEIDNIEAKQDQTLANFFSQKIFWGIFYKNNGGDEEALAVNNRRMIPLTWFRQIADSKFASLLKEIAKIAKNDLEQLIYEGILYQEFFELQILIKDESIAWLKNNATKGEILRHHGFNDMLGYKYFLKRVREGIIFSDKTYDNGFDARKLTKFSDMVAGGDRAFLPCELPKNELHFGGSKWQKEYEFVADGDY